MTKPSKRPTRAWSALRELIHTEAAGGIALLAAAVLALVIANTPLATSYAALFHAYLGPLSLQHWINDGLMALFFLLVGLELKRELLDGALSTWSRRVLPGSAALAGMAVPALIYLAINAGDDAGLRGWAIPAATDIAFALCVLALLGKRVPASLKVLLTAIAVIDDLGAILVIALFYTATLGVLPLVAAGLAVLGLLTLNRLGVRALWPYLIVGAGLWAAVLLSGIHATLAGVITAAFVPIENSPGAPDHARSPLHRLEHLLHPWVALGILPVFAFANAGVRFAGINLATLTGGIPLGVFLGLAIGKQLGVFGVSWALIRTRVVDLPAHTSLRHLWGMAAVCGIGFTMSLFIGALAFPGQPEMVEDAKVGTLVGSIVSAALGYVVLRLAGTRRLPRDRGNPTA